MVVKNESKFDQVFKVFNYSVLAIALIIVLYPLIYIVSASISDPALVNSGKMWFFPKGITFEGYKRVFDNSEIWIGYRNTIFYTVLGTAINLFVTLPAAYALSRKDFVGRNIFMAMFVFTMFFSGGLIPTYLLVKSLGMVNTIWAMVLPNAAAVWNIIICMTFFQVTIPKELEEAAIIDGCSTTKLFFKIIIPLSAPIIAVMALFYGVGHWNGYFNALIYLSDQNLYPLQLVLRQILVLQEMGSQMTGSGAAGAAASAMHNKAEIAAIIKYAVMIISTLPIIIIYPFLQRFFVKGVMIGSIKG
ncbi:carbohydrate ABC transporter membrane protein 2 (CUT1 family) [Scopulibacillus darangshiensis]|uniref:Carbohydrate ABC transporter membrane protein 2 (CUT1 family) n=1 Tax=Scopulibacillus darangshiensis TaxID=442528 RepID=A0A4R2NV74_9BACL|nr:carbohydrate ABC transporter permease [Scopulibacillus darangshiensis]TCP25983.1 carbohydrate ABC transporter membrane protein 2 (CUT1 family) [Scopulibacillus darangshiensis]